MPSSCDKMSHATQTHSLRRPGRFRALLRCADQDPAPLLGGSGRRAAVWSGLGCAWEAI